MAQIIDGKSVAEELRKQLTEKVNTMINKPKLSIIIVGNRRILHPMLG